MADNQINRFLEFTNMQMAAEAFLIRSGDGGVLGGSDGIQARLGNGNFHASKFTPTQADQFVAQYEVLAQYRNDPTLASGSGFSGTLFRNRETGELTLSFRSTEFIDDAVRDSKSTNELEIKDLGWAFGQISEMEAWYAQLRADPNLLGGWDFNVTGYSLGGHLATAFNILRGEEAAATGNPNPVISTWTFNGAGTGAILNNRRLADLISDFNRIRANYAASPEWTALSTGEQGNLRAAAQFRIDTINSERLRVSNLSGITRAFATPAPAGSQALPEYQIAALLVGRNTRGASNFPFFNGTNDIPGSPVFAAQVGLPGIGNMTEIVGSDGGKLGPSFVSNSGIHYGTRQQIYIEDQPLTRGTYSLLRDRGSLVSNPDQNDFADTHSLVLIVDALSLMAVFETLDPAFTPETASGIFQAISSAAASAAFGTQGRVEGDTLEGALDALRRLFVDADAEPTPSSLEGNTWHDSIYRNPFHDNLSELNAHIEGEQDGLAGKFRVVPLAGVDASAMTARAQTPGAIGAAWRYALVNLNPFVVEPADGSMQLARYDEAAYALYDAAVRPDGLTVEYLADRAAMLSWKNFDTVANGRRALRGSETLTYRFIDQALTDGNNNPLTLTVAGRQVSAVSTPVKVIFGGEQGDTLSGGNVYTGDRLYGGGGDDTLTGNSGSDYLEGGIGLDTYSYASGDGFDTIRDTDGLGRVLYDGLAAGPGRQVGEGIYLSDDKRLGYLLEGDLAASGTLTINGDIQIRDFRNGDLGITLRDGVDVAPIQPTENVVETPHQIELGSDLADFYVSGLLNAPDPQFPNSFPTYDSLFLGFDGDDLVSAVEVPVDFDPGQFIYGGTGNDILAARSRFAHLYGEGGRDVIHGDAGNDALFGDVDIGSLNFSGSLPGNLTVEIRYGDNNTGMEPLFAYSENAGRFWDGDTGDQIGPDLHFSGGFGEVLQWLGVVSPENQETTNADFISGGAGDDAIFGGAGGDVLYGGEGNDQLHGGSSGIGGVAGIFNDSLRSMPQQLAQQIRSMLVESGDDYLDGGGGNDTLTDSDGGSDYLTGGAGDDTLTDENPDTLGVASFNDLEGGDGNDRLTSLNSAPGGYDTLAGGPGDDILSAKINASMEGGSGADQYLVAWDGLSSNVHIDNHEDTPGGHDSLFLKREYATFDPLAPELADFWTALRTLRGDALTDAVIDRDLALYASRGDVSITRDASNLYFGFGDDESRVAIDNWFEDDTYKLEVITVQDFIQTLNGSSTSQRSYTAGDIASYFSTPTEGSDSLWGGRGNDSILADAGDDQIFGGKGDDRLFGDAGDDSLAGNSGDDYLNGGIGDDTYYFGRNSGSDLIEDGSGNDSIVLEEGIAPDDVRVTSDAGRLFLNFTGSPDQLGVEWRPQNNYQIEQVQFSDGTVWDAAALLARVVEPLPPPAPGPVTVPPESTAGGDAGAGAGGPAPAAGSEGMALPQPPRNSALPDSPVVQLSEADVPGVGDASSMQTGNRDASTSLIRSPEGLIHPAEATGAAFLRPEFLDTLRDIALPPLDIPLSNHGTGFQLRGTGAEEQGGAAKQPSSVSAANAWAAMHRQLTALLSQGLDDGVSWGDAAVPEWSLNLQRQGGWGAFRSDSTPIGVSGYELAGLQGLSEGFAVLG